MGVEDFPWVGGRPSLDLCNTAAGGPDLIDDETALSAWLTAAGCAKAAQPPGDADVARIRRLRDDLRDGFIARDPGAMAEILDGWLRATSGHLSVDRETLQPAFRADPSTFGCVITPILLDALTIVRDGMDRVRVCAADDCSMLFLDCSRNGSRRWCSMDRCGSRAKANAYYERKRAERGPGR